MTIQTANIFRRTADDEEADMLQCRDNYEKGEWQSWPNNGAFEGLEEHRGPIQLNVTGSIPSWAAGILYRTGPGQSVIEDTSRGTHRVSHWFDGFAHTHRFDIAPSANDNTQCSVTYSSRRQSDEFVELIRRKGWRTGISFAQKNDPCVGLFAKFMSYFLPSPVVNNVCVVADMPEPSCAPPLQSARPKEPSNLYLTTDAAVLQKVDPRTLEPLGQARQTELHPDLKGPLSCAHAQRDPETGDLFNVNVDLGIRVTYRIFRVNADSGTTDILATISDKELPAAYIHSFFLTQNYVILCVPTSHLAWRGMRVLWERNVIEALKPFNPKNKCKWVVVDRRHGKGVVATFSTPPAFFFHSINAFEEISQDESGNKVTSLYLDYIEFKSTDLMHFLYHDVLANRDGAGDKAMEQFGFKAVHSEFVRQKFNMHPQDRSRPYCRTAEKIFSIPNPHSGELPTINPHNVTKPYRYVYGIANRGRAFMIDTLVKTDLKTKEAMLWEGPVGHTPGEPIFIPRPGGVQEDDGLVLSLVLDGSASRSYLLCLDALTFEELGRAETNFAIPLGFHGSHVSSGDVAIEGRRGGNNDVAG
ncbi:hypothetical protein QQS21_001969 [Conoideocrella luteorostrata]|uniref:Carotenoid cleavage dioxygenase 1 n=1 Tax=Conoideocrella luteorostrata TaxID=1105319 RepID=A0AAJ0CYK8_9HYPO|nr:hypothetical protein QQS21_001969 [Conoideocrella luteorostrata]